MNVNVSLKIEILDGTEAGRVFTDSFIRNTETTVTEYGIKEDLRLAWTYIHPEHPICINYIHEHIREEDSRE